MAKAKQDYPLIRVWCHIMGSAPYYVEDELDRAREDKAPQNAIYQKTDMDTGKRVWTTADEVTSPSNKPILDKAWKEWKEGK